MKKLKKFSEKEFKVRASSADSLLTNPKSNSKKSSVKTKAQLNKSKNNNLSVTTKSYLNKWLKDYLYGFRTELKNKEVKKGLLLEDKAIDFAIQALDLGFVLKNEKLFEDEYFKGTPDVILEDEILDIKCSWSHDTFSLLEESIPTKEYIAQLQVYMYLTGKKKSRLVYVLMNTPSELTYEESFDYESLPNILRIKTFDVSFDQEIINKLIDRVKLSRTFLKKQYGNITGHLH